MEACPGAAQIACLMLVIVAALIALERRGLRRRGFAALGTDGQLASRITLAGAGRWVAAGACFLPVVLGFLLPAGYLLREVAGRGLLAGFDTNLVRYTLTTVVLASTATAITLVIGFLGGRGAAIHEASGHRGLREHRRHRLRRAGHGACARACFRRSFWWTMPSML